MPRGVKYRGRATQCDLNRAVAMISQTPIFTIHAELGDIRHFGQHALWRATGDRYPRRPHRRAEAPAAASCPARDWQIVRPDGATDLKARYGIETDHGARVLVTSDGLRHGPPEVIAALARGDAVDPARYYFRTVMRFETAEPTLAWLNRIFALGTGAREKLAVRLDVYEVV